MVFASSVRTATVMASPVTVALATRWIADSTGDALLAAVRCESIDRQKLAAAILPKAMPGGGIRPNPIGFHLWGSLPEPWTRSAFVRHMRSTGIGLVASDAFTTDGTPPEAVRVCLGGPRPHSGARRARVYGARTRGIADTHVYFL